MGTVLVTGGAGFIGSNFVRHALAATEDRVVVVDALTYAGNLESLEDVASHRGPRWSCPSSRAGWWSWPSTSRPKFPTL